MQTPCASLWMNRAPRSKARNRLRFRAQPRHAATARRQFPVVRVERSRAARPSRYQVRARQPVPWSPSEASVASTARTASFALRGCCASQFLVSCGSRWHRCRAACTQGPRAAGRGLIAEQYLVAPPAPPAQLALREPARHRLVVRQEGHAAARRAVPARARRYPGRRARLVGLQAGARRQLATRQPARRRSSTWSREGCSRCQPASAGSARASRSADRGDFALERA